MKQDTPSLIVTSGQFARIAGVSVESVRAWERAGRVQCQRTVGGLRLFDARDAERIAAERGTLPQGA